MKSVAEHHVDKYIAMVGPVTSDEHRTVGLFGYPNVIATGARKIDELPSYFKYFDCGIIPFKKNTLTRSIYPLKINEYLAAGLPVVTTDFSEDIESFGDVVYMARGHKDFIALIDRAMSEDSANRVAARTAVANGNTWTRRVEEFWQILEQRKAELV